MEQKIMSNKLDNQVTLDGAAVGAVSNGWLEWGNTSGTQQAGLFTGNGVPVGTLGGRLTAAVAMYMRIDAVSASTVLYVTSDIGVTWTPLTAP
jgi:pullulanase/glycogen debranching enzyme